MSMQTFFKSLISTSTRQRPIRRRSPASRLYLEQLEDRTLPSSFTAATVSDLTADINAANQQAGSNTITLAAPISFPYALTALDNATDGATGLPVIVANDNLTIIGNGDTIERSPAAGIPAFRLWDVASGAALTLENLTLQGGSADGSGVSAWGGAIYSQGSLTLSGVTVQGNTARGSDGMLGGGIGWDAPAGSDGLGGGLYAAGGTVTISSSILFDNQALGGNGGNGYSVKSEGFNGGNGGNGLGGAVYVAAGTVIMTDSTLSANFAQGGRGGGGGGAITDDFNLNSYGGAGGAGGFGGGGAVVVAAGTLVMTNDTLSANTAQGGRGGDGGWGYDLSSYGYYPGGHGGNAGSGASGMGGGLSVTGGTVTLTGATVSSNSALGGTGGLGGVGDVTSGQDGNPGLGKGGGLYIAPAAPPLADLDTFTESNTINNVADIDPNISGPYSLNGTSTQPSSFTVSGFPSSTTAGVAGSFTVTAKNADGTTDIRYWGTVQFSSSDTQAGLPADYAFAEADAGVHTFSAVLKTAGTQSVTATDATTVSVTGTENGITVNPAASSHFGVSAPAGSMAGSAFSVTLTARDPYGNTATGYTGTVHFASTDGQANLPGDYTFTAADAGVHTFSATLKTAGTQSLIATDTVSNSITGNSAVTVSPAAASTFTVAWFPSPVTAGVAGSFTVTARDPYGNQAVSYTGTVHFTSSDAKAVLPGNYTFAAADARLRLFSAALKTAGTQSITAGDTTTSGLAGSEGGITVNPAAASQFIITGPSSVSAGIRFSLTITVEDAYGNVVTGYTGTVHFTSTDPKATLPKNYTFTAADKGMHTFSGLVLRKRGAQKITLTDTLNSSLTGSVIENVL